MTFIHFLSSPCSAFFSFHEMIAALTHLAFDDGDNQDPEKAQGFSLWRLLSVSMKILTFLSSLSLEIKMKSVCHGDG